MEVRITDFQNGNNIINDKSDNDNRNECRFDPQRERTILDLIEGTNGKKRWQKNRWHK